ncbi:hypothetical protein [Paenibacillus sp. YYML68]|uniref:hypothetical protein n=1 Tax=Paenibacillus sp. YYML68 TaxID=2909250 RepID=UPI00248FBCAF|nr:hypothetical protein [Paenibacillus sp. YYML68]
MSHSDKLSINQQELAAAWNRTLPMVLNTSDKAEVLPDEAETNALRVHIVTAGRNLYSFDFKCTYVDAREVKVELIDVERDNVSVDERTTIIQTMVDDYIRHLHECAQQLHALTSR